jgi:type I restriction enzyme S subunit
MLLAIESVLWGYDNSLQRAFALWRSLSHAEFSKRAGSGPALNIHFTIASGQVDPRKPEYAKLPLIAPNHIEPGRGRVTKLVSAEAQAAISGKYLYEAGSVLYSKIRPELRKAAIAPCRGLCSSDMYPLTPSQQLRAEYLLEILLSDAFSRFAVSGSMRTGMPKVNRKHLAEFCCDLPCTEDQDQYLSHVRALHAAMDQIAERRTSLVSLKSIALGEMEVA